MAEDGRPSRVQVFGSINIDLVVRVPSIPRPGETVLAPGHETFLGGKGANQAVAASRYGQEAGIVASLCGRVGPDGFGDTALAGLSDAGVGVAGVTRGAEPTGCAFIAVDRAGENAIAVASGANAALRADDVPDSALAGAVLVLQMEVPPAESLSVARRARAAGAAVIWNLAPAPPDLDGGTLRAILRLATLLVVNEHEAVSAAASLGLSADDAPDAAAALAGEGGATVVLTRGARGALAIGPDGTGAEAPSLSVAPVDTTGAGDTFVGLLAVEHALGTDLATALGRACAGAALACLSAGAQAGMPTRATVLARLG